jgi:AbrB family looped-hinge helix DNA binding protein
MPVLSPKRQVTLPKELCDRLKVEPGDDLQILEHEGRITILKRVKGASKGVLRHVKVNRQVSDAESRDDAMAKAGRGAARQSPRHAAA